MGIYFEFEGIPTGNISDACGGRGVMDHEILPLDRRMTLCGKARTVLCAPGDNLAIYRAVLSSEPGDILVINCGGYSYAGVFGEMLALNCRTRGIKGIVIDGTCRDKNELIEMGLPVFARGTSPKGTTKSVVGTINEPTFCGGVTVRPGDVIVGDCDGVIVIPKEEAEAILAAAKKKKQREDEMRPLLNSGTSLAELLGLIDKLERR